ncbi:trehalase family glycosidase [uncultured Desulfobulbus sp.]|uniref:MGH1-like glycoside hydrolase domain-containing protein n=1 Tax=uncultured Desulfobulbus sp. TaxID=239745 RepID=UPI0029C87C7B|nr:trehalase family glycosidase [uncultured Desulfobulbus sp.]
MRYFMILLCAASTISLAYGKGDELKSISLVSPVDKTVIKTPLTCILKWDAIDGAASYDVTVTQSGKRKPVITAKGIIDSELRLAVKPGLSYVWNVAAVDGKGICVAESKESTFSVAEPVLAEVTDNNVLFAGMFPNAHWVEMAPVKADGSAVISPWFSKKKFDDAPPSFIQAKSRLPIPIWDGHQDSIDMYWSAWDILFSTWLYAPPSKDNLAVSNVIGMPTWAGWGSTMVLDTAFILQFARYGDTAYPFITSLDNCYARQHENGFICRETDNNNWEVLSGWPVNPPLLAWSEWRYYEVTGDVERLKKVYLPLVKQYEWYMLHQRRMNGAYWTNGLNESDDLTRNQYAHSFISTTCVQGMSAEIMAKMSKIVGRPDMASWFDGEYKTLSKLANDLFWDERFRLYNDLNVKGQPITLTPDGHLCKHWHSFWPLLTGIATKERFGYLAEHILDKTEFCRLSGTASLSADSFGYNKDTGAYWRGAVWPPVQYVTVEGLHRAGLDDAAYYSASRYYNAFLTVFKAKNDITEFMAPDKSEMYGMGSFVGWGGVAPIAFLIEEMLGIRPDAPSNTIDWDIRQVERHGMKNLHFGNHTVSLICEARKSADDSVRLTVESDGEFTLKIHLGKKIQIHNIQNGRTEISDGRLE